MLTRLRFKNWRSLHEVGINTLTPLVVLVGENSSGKTNLLDGLYFLRDTAEKGGAEAVFARGGIEKIRTIGTAEQESVELEFSFHPDASPVELTYTLVLKPGEGALPKIAERLVDQQGVIWLKSDDGEGVHVRQPGEDLHRVEDAPLGSDETVLSAFGRSDVRSPIYQTFQFITRRWQLLDENFMPPLSLPAGATGDPYVIDRCADNVPIMLDFLQKANRSEYEELQADLTWLLGHVQNLAVESSDRETRFLIKEAAHRGQEAPTISAGTERMVAILTALHTLNLRFIQSAGLVAIEEPDTSVHPLLLNRLVELLRGAVTGENRRQVILTTHNPRLLDLFRPEEVRIVERNTRGETAVRDVPMDIVRIWIAEYGLGDVWMTRALGGVPD